MSLKNLNVGTKLLLGFLSIALLVAVMGVVGVVGARQTSRSFNDTTNSSVPAIRALLEIKSTANQIATQIAEFQLIDGGPGGEEGTETANQKYALIARVERIDIWAERYERALMARERNVRVTFAQVLGEAWGGVVNRAFEVLELKERGISGISLDEKTSELTDAQDRLEELIAEATDDELTQMREGNVSVSSALERTLNVNIWVSVLSLAVAASVSLVFARSIGGRIRRLRDSVERFGADPDGASAPLPVGSGDEIHQLGQSFNEMTERLEKTTVHRDRLAAIGEHAAGFVHNINNPLAAILQFSQLVMDQELERSVKRDVLTIHEQAEWATKILQDLLAFANQRESSKADIVVNEILQEALTLNALGFRTHHIDVQLDLATDIPRVLANKNYLLQVFINILANAEQSMTKARSRGVLRIHGRQVGENMRLSFADDGIGIAKDDLQKIFEVFYTTKELGKGAGLGLSVSYGIILEHGGKLWAESELGKGATFHLELPGLSSQKSPKAAGVGNSK